MKNVFRIFSVIFLLGILTTCKKEAPVEPENPSFDPNTATASIVNINTTEVGGNGLILVSALDENSPLNKGTFNTVVSTVGEQLLFVTDENSKLRALTLSTPSNNQNNVLEVNSSSTASSLIFLTPGIITTESEIAKTTITQIQNLSSFAAFNTFIKNSIKNKNLNDLVQDPTYSSLLTACIEEYMAKKNPTSKGESEEVGSSSILEYKNLFNLNQLTDNSLELKNYAYRYVTIAERDMSETSSETGVKTLLPAMSGAVPISWGSLFATNTAWDPTITKVDYSPSSSVSYSEIWVIGIGLKPLTDTPPASIQSIEKPIVETVVKYVIFPVIDLLSGGSSFLNQSADVAKFSEFISKVKVGINVFNVTNSLTSGDNVALRRDLANLSVSIFGVIAKTSIPGVGQALGLASLAFGAANMGPFISDMITVEPYSKFIVNSADGLPVAPLLETPLISANNVNRPVTFFWKSAINATKYELQISKAQDFAVLEFSLAGITTIGKEVSTLKSGQKYYWRVRSNNKNGNSSWSDTWNFTTTSSIATVTTSAVNNPAATSATVGGNVTEDGGATVTDRGVFWGTSQNPESTGTKLQIGNGTGAFSTSLNSLNPNTTYYVKAYAINSRGSAYGTQLSFTTPINITDPIVTTNWVTTFSSTTATVGGNVTSDGNATLTERGVYWGINSEPQTTGTKLQIGNGIGSYSASLSGLNQNTTYYVKAYAINSHGTGYGSQTSFTTTASTTTTGKISGIVRNASSAAPLSGVSVTVFLSTSTVGTSTSQSNGLYETNVPVNTGYKVIFSKQGFLSAEYQNVNVTTGGNTILEPILQIDQAYAGTGSLSGTIKNALNGTGISGVSLKLRSGINVTTGTILSTATTNSTGLYTFTGIPAGNYTVEATNSGYNTSFFSVLSLGGQTTANQDANMSPILTTGETRIVLTWGATPADLDSHFTGPLSDGNRFHMYYPLTGTGSPWPQTVLLDLDDVTSYGPETTTLIQQIAGVYRFSVHDFTNKSLTSSTALSNSGAQVKIYQNSGLVATFNVPPNTEGTLWTVFEMTGSTITPVNQLTYQSSQSAVSKGSYINPDLKLFINLPDK